MEKPIPFANDKSANDLWREVILLLIRELDARLTKHIPPENHQTFCHGKNWTFQRQDRNGYSPQTGVFERTAANFRIDASRVLANDVTVLVDFIAAIADDLEKRFFDGMLAEMNSVVEQAGNTISISASGSLADAFLEMVKTVEMGVDAAGNVTRPTLILPPEMMDRLRREIEERGPDFKNQIDLARTAKEEQALQREADRLARFDQTE